MTVNLKTRIYLGLFSIKKYNKYKKKIKTLIYNDSWFKNVTIVLHLFLTKIITILHLLIVC